MSGRILEIAEMGREILRDSGGGGCIAGVRGTARFGGGHVADDARGGTESAWRRRRFAPACGC